MIDVVVVVDVAVVPVNVIVAAAPKDLAIMIGDRYWARATITPLPIEKDCAGS